MMKQEEEDERIRREKQEEDMRENLKKISEENR